jgi:hypothetical protein
MDNTRCIFPAASKIATAIKTGDQHTSNELLQHQRNQMQPFITINPSFLQSVTGDELLVAFDEIMAMAFTDSSSDDPCSFILPEEATSASWIDLVRSYATTYTTASTSNSLQSIPLYILVLCRFQHSLAKSYAGRNDGESDSQIISNKSTAQWLSALKTRIHELETTGSTEIERLRSKFASKFPEIGEHVEGNAENKKCSLEQYLLLPFTVVAGRLGKDSSDNVDVLKTIDLCIEETLQDGFVEAKEPSNSMRESSQAEDGVSADNTSLPPGNENQTATNNGTTDTPSGGKKKKKKKKKVCCVDDRIILYCL